LALAEDNDRQSRRSVILLVISPLTPDQRISGSPRTGAFHLNSATVAWPG